MTPICESHKHGEAFSSSRIRKKETGEISLKNIFYRTKCTPHTIVSTRREKTRVCVVFFVFGLGFAIGSVDALSRFGPATTQVPRGPVWPGRRAGGASGPAVAVAFRARVACLVLGAGGARCC